MEPFTDGSWKKTTKDKKKKEIPVSPNSRTTRKEK